jgi:hypothetical protein
MKLFRRCLILTHRYLGIALSLLIIMWFGTGIVMMYAGGMPRLTPELRVARLPELDLSRVRLTPAEAAAQAGLPHVSGRAALLSVMDRPAYRFAGRETVFADTGEVLEELSPAQSRATAGRFMKLPEDQVHYVRTLTQVDQWTLGQGREMPLHKFRVDDASLTELYVSPQTGELTTLTTRRSRTLAWIGTIPHWLYFAALRVNQPVWYRIVVWTSALACVLAVLGLILSVTQFRRSRPFRVAASIPYSGWMRWHYMSGVVFGVFTLTWAFSGLLSMEPFAWTNATGLEVRRDVLTGGPVDLSRFPAMDQVAWNRVLEGRAIKEVDFVRIQGEHFYLVRHALTEETAAARRERLHQPYNVTGHVEPDRLLMAANTLEIRREPFSVESLMARLRTAVPDVPIAESQLLSEYDSYYYSRGRQTPLPVLRVKFADPAETWFYIDPEMSQVVAQIHRLNRLERWLYNGLHSLDFAFWYDSPLWDVAMIVLSLGGLSVSAIGLVLGIRRVRRGTARLVRAAAARPAAAVPATAEEQAGRTTCAF